MRVPNHDVRNDGLGPYAVFYCEQCGKEYRSKPAVIATITKDVTRNTLGGFLRNIPIVGDGLANSVEGQDPRSTYALTPEQLDSAWQEVQPSFRECPTCMRVVCMADWDQVAGTCQEDSPRAGEIEEEKAARAARAVQGFAGAFGLGGVLQGITESVRTAASNMATCSKCGTMAVAGTKFCPSCGGQMIQPATQTCSSCSQPVPAGMQFCPNCGTKVEQAVAAPAAKKCPNCGTESTSAFCGNCGTKIS